MRAEVELWSTDPSAVAAVRHTIQQLPPGNGLLFEEDGHWFLVGNDFLRWACERQGYVKRVIEVIG
jgi:hypothetical protein